MVKKVAQVYSTMQSLSLKTYVNFAVTIFFLETFQMGKVHKDIAMFMVEAAKNEEYDDQRLVKVIENFLFMYKCVYPNVICPFTS